MTDGQASISADILARYAADAANEVEGVCRLAGRRGVKIERSGASEGDAVRVELRLVVDWGAPLTQVGQHVQERVRDYLVHMAGIRPTVDVVVEAVGQLR
jgi:uncharacterized alkaline shock family protein YloU